MLPFASFCGMFNLPTHSYTLILPWCWWTLNSLMMRLTSTTSPDSGPLIGQHGFTLTNCIIAWCFSGPLQATCSVGSKILIIDYITLSCANCILFILNLLCLPVLNKLTLAVSEVCFFCPPYSFIDFSSFYWAFTLITAAWWTWKWHNVSSESEHAKKWYQPVMVRKL